MCDALCGECISLNGGLCGECCPLARSATGCYKILIQTGLVLLPRVAIQLAASASVVLPGAVTLLSGLLGLACLVYFIIILIVVCNSRAKTWSKPIYCCVLSCIIIALVFEVHFSFPFALPLPFHALPLLALPFQVLLFVLDIVVILLLSSDDAEGLFDPTFLRARPLWLPMMVVVEVLCWAISLCKVRNAVREDAVRAARAAHTMAIYMSPVV